MNRGDAELVKLTIMLDDVPIEEGYADDIELTFNPQCGMFCVQKSLQDETIYWSNQYGCYVTFITQEDSFKMKVGTNTVQLRILKNNTVISSTLNSFILGGVNSHEVLV